MDNRQISELIASGGAYLGIELGSTRIKGVLVDAKGTPLASGAHDWENRLENGVWTYTLDDVWNGMQDCYASLAADVNEKYGVKLTKLGAIGISAMMHGYLAFDANDKLLAPFRTWRNTMTEQASNDLTEALGFHIPQRWSAAHLYQAILNKEDHVKDIKSVCTLAVYVHWMLTGQRVAGVGEASGMFPIDSATIDYDSRMVDIFDGMTAKLGFNGKLRDVFPAVLTAGENAGALTESGAKLLDPTGALEAGIPFCPPEGDAGTGMVATNSVTVRTGNVSAGTSVFGMVVMERPLSKAYETIDVVTTPSGDPVAMVHCNNCTGDFDAWVRLFGEFAAAAGMDIKKPQLYDLLYQKALEADYDCGGLAACNYLSGEHVTGFTEGRPLFVRTPDSNFNLANFMRTHLYTALSVLKSGMSVLTGSEKVAIDTMFAHGGLFKTPVVGQRILAAALNTPVAVMETAGEGGAWGIAILAAYSARLDKAVTLTQYLADEIFCDSASTVIAPDADEVAGFDRYLERYMNMLDAEKAAVASFKA